MKLVCITGIDGAGKSTLARSTVAALRRQGQPAAYIYGRTYPLISRALMALGRMTMLRGKDQWRDYRAYSSSKKQRMRSPLLAAIYTAAILLDYYLQIWLKLLPHLFSRRIVVADRYVYDTVISDLAVHLNYSANQTMRAIDCGLKLLPMPMLAVLLDAPEEIAFARKDDVPHIDYLRERREWYLMLMARYEVKAFNGEAAPDALVQALVAEIAAYESNLAGSANNANKK
jgi:thymidylate kinase